MAKSMVNTKRIVLAAFAAILLLTGALNLRAVIGSGDDRNWEADPSAPSLVDALLNPGQPSARRASPLDDQILAWQDRLRADANDGTAATALGHAYLQKARETGDPAYYPKTEGLFGLGLERNEDDFAAMTGMGTLALARHEFAEALTWGERAVAVNPHFPAAYGVIGDAQIELGRYDEAAATVQRMVDLRPDLASFTRVSYVRELMGDTEGAIAAMERAATAGSGSAENVAWTRTQLGNLLFGRGDLDGAQRRYEEALAVLPGYAPGTAGLARIAAAQGNLSGAIDLYAEAIRVMPLPEFVIALGDLYEAAGRPAEAAEQRALVAAMQRLYADNGVDLDVELALFAADNGGDLKEAVAKTRAAVEQRPSIWVADALAWSLYKSGDYTGAQAASQEALRLGTENASLLYHAGMIEAALGNRDAAAGYLFQALAINPHFSPLHAPRAKETLNQLQGGA